MVGMLGKFLREGQVADNESPISIKHRSLKWLRLVRSFLHWNEVFRDSCPPAVKHFSVLLKTITLWQGFSNDPEIWNFLEVRSFKRRSVTPHRTGIKVATRCISPADEGHAIVVSAAALWPAPSFCLPRFRFKGLIIWHCLLCWLSPITGSLMAPHYKQRYVKALPSWQVRLACDPDQWDRFLQRNPGWYRMVWFSVLWLGEVITWILHLSITEIFSSCMPQF